MIRWEKKEEIKIINSIKITGNERIDSFIIESYLNLSDKEKYTPEKANESIKTLYSTGLFENVSIDYKDKQLLIKVKENPLISEILFDGNKKIDDDVLLSEISLTKRSVFNKNKLNNDLKRILDLYRRTGRFTTTIVPKIIKEKNNRIKLVFEINEGKPAKIRNIYIIGANVFDEDDLKSSLNSKESKFFRFSSSEIYDPPTADKTSKFGYPFEK